MNKTSNWFTKEEKHILWKVYVISDAILKESFETFIRSEIRQEGIHELKYLLKSMMKS